jgi:hypothetical protein
MTLSNFSRKLLSKGISLKLKNGRKRKWVGKQRPTFGEFCSLHKDARVHSNKFKYCLIMSKTAFDTLLKRLELHLCEPATLYRESIPAEHRLVVTVR